MTEPKLQWIHSGGVKCGNNTLHHWHQSGMLNGALNANSKFDLAQYAVVASWVGLQMSSATEVWR